MTDKRGGEGREGEGTNEKTKPRKTKIGNENEGTVQGTVQGVSLPYVAGMRGPGALLEVLSGMHNAQHD